MILKSGAETMAHLRGPNEAINFGEILKLTKVQVRFSFFFLIHSDKPLKLNL